MYARLKCLEDRVLFLESLSPEYSTPFIHPFKTSLEHRSGTESCFQVNTGHRNLSLGTTGEMVTSSESRKERRNLFESQLSAVLSISGQIKQVNPFCKALEGFGKTFT